MFRAQVYAAEIWLRYGLGARQVGNGALFGGFEMAGIGSTCLNRGFWRFYRLESARSEQPGHGLGLSLAQAIAGYHGGKLELGNNHPGLQVRVRFPV